MKHRGYYLQKVCFVLADGAYLLPFEDVVESLQEKGIHSQLILAKEPVLSKLTEGGGESKGDCPQVLYVTDRGEVAKKLLEAGAAVLGYCHEGNPGENFEGVKYVLEQPQGIETEYFERVFRRYAGLPWSILETERCYARESTVEDVESFYAIYEDRAVTHYTEGLYESSASLKAYMQEYAAHMYTYYEFGIWTVILKETGEIIGRAGLSVREGQELPELGYVFGVPWQGKGLAREVCAEILKYAREELGLEKVQVLIQKENEASQNLAKRLGFVYERSLQYEAKEWLILVKIYTK